MEKKILLIKGTFNNMYAWGVGWDSSTREKWYEYWKQTDSILWTFFRQDDIFASSDYLVSIGCAIFLHPMGFDVVYDAPTTESSRKQVLDELYQLCKGCADYCGGKFSMKISEIENVSFQDIKEYTLA